METSASTKKTSPKEKIKKGGEKKATKPQENIPQDLTPAEDEEENPFGGMKAGNFKRNLGCGG